MVIIEMAICECTCTWGHGPLTRYVKLRVAPERFFPALRVSYPDMYHGMCVTHVSWCIPGLLTSGFLWSRWRGKCSRHSRRMRNPQFYASDKRPMGGFNGTNMDHGLSFWIFSCILSIVPSLCEGYSMKRAVVLQNIFKRGYSSCKNSLKLQ